MSEKEFISLAEFCRQNNITRARGSQLKPAGLPMHKSKVVMPDASEWYERNVLKALREEAASHDGLTPRERLTESQIAENVVTTAIKTLELRKREGALADVAEIEEVWSRIVTNTRSRLLSLPGSLSGKLAPVTDAREIQEILRKAIYAILNELAGMKLGRKVKK